MDWFLDIRNLRRERYICIKNIQSLVFFKHLLKNLGINLIQKIHNILVYLQANA